MSLLDLLSPLMGQDDYDNTDDMDFDEEQEQPSQRRRPSLFRSRAAEPEDDGEEESDVQEPQRPRLFRSRATSQQNAEHAHAMEVGLLKPLNIDQALDVCDYLLQNKAVVLNLEGLTLEAAQRIIDFTSGAVYAEDGNLQMISNNIFIVTPHDVELSGEFQDMIANNAASFNVSGLNIKA